MSADAVDVRDVFCVHRSTEGDAAALQGLSLRLRHGERLCVLGPSGAGKTTLLQVVAGLRVPSVGSVLVFGIDIGRQPGRRRARLRHRLIGFLDQRAEASLPPELTVAEAVALPLALRGARRSERRTRAGELLRAAGLQDRAQALPSELSGGERQRAALCAALAHRPSLLLADEPTAELDEASARQMAALIDEMATADGTTVITVSHDPAMAQGVQRVVRMRDGRIVEERRGGQASLVVGADGWVRLPRPLLQESGIGGWARVAAGPGGLVLTPSDPAPLPPLGPVAPPAPLPGELREPAIPAAPRPTPIQLESVWRWRGQGTSRRAVLADLSAELGPGGLTVIIGRSGSGKTTLLELLACLAQPDCGELIIAGERVGALGAEGLAALRRRRLGYLPQEPAPVGFLSAVENVAVALVVRGIGAEEARDRAEEVMSEVGLAERRRQRVARLSLGEAQRVALARALVCACGLLVVDEPTSRLDSDGAAAVAALLRRAAQDGHTVVCATHDPLLIERADQTLELGRPAARSHSPAAAPA
jgi:ABC-type lipoprotein export system ATPase subunit